MQDTLFELFESDERFLVENPSYLTEQLITYLGNKRSLLSPIGEIVEEVRSRLGGRRLVSLDLFSGSGAVSRLLKQHSSTVIANDLELYSRAVNLCFLANRSEVDIVVLSETVERLNALADEGAEAEGFFRELYAPADEDNITPEDRVFYTVDNARRLDFYSDELTRLPQEQSTFLLGPLLSSASVHVNTSGVFKGFYKDGSTGRGAFGGGAGNALSRIRGRIQLRVPEMSRFTSDYFVHQEDAVVLAGQVGEVDFAYLDPPYNQHPYGSNYFMLNLLCTRERPLEVSAVSGIPREWNRSVFNKRQSALKAMNDCVSALPAKYVLVSFNNEGFIAPEEMRTMLESYGKVELKEVEYNVFRGSRNLRNRTNKVIEQFFILEKN